MAGVGGEQLPGGQRNTLASDQYKRDLDALQRKLKRELSEAIASVRSEASLVQTRYTFCKGILVSDTGQTWTDMPAAETEIFSLTVHRVIVDLALVRSARLNCRILTVGLAGSRLYPQFSTDNAGSWNDLFDTATLPLDGSDVVATSGWANIVSDAKADEVLIRIVGAGGDGAADPKFGIVDIEFSTTEVP